MKREVGLAIAVGVLAGIAGALSARSAGPQDTPPSTASAGTEAAAAPDLRARMGPEPSRAATALATLLRVQVTPAAEVTLRLARWSQHAGKGIDGEWVALPPARTSPSGHAELELAAGTYWVGAASAWATVELTTVAEVELTLDPGVRLSGRVLEAGAQRPIAGALITAGPASVSPDSEQRTAQSDGLGRFAIDGLPRGEVSLEVSAPGHRLSSEKADAPGTSDVLLEPSCRVDGVVVNGEGASVSGVEPTDATVLAGPGGRFSLEVDCAGAELIARDAAGRIGSAKVAKGQRTVTLTLEPSVTLAGRVRMSSGEAVGGAEVAAMTSGDQVRVRTLTDDQGAFTLASMLPGRFIVRARKGRGALAAAYGVDAPSTSPLELVLEPGAVLDGEVTGGDDPIEVEVRWPAMRDERPVHARTAAGHFHLEDLPPGVATVIATTPGSGAEERVFLNAGQSAQVQLQLVGLGRILGHVTGQNVADAEVAIDSNAWRARRWQPVKVSGDGHFSLQVPAGKYKIDARPKGSMVVAFDHEVAVVAGQDVTVELPLRPGEGPGWGPMPSVARGEIGGSFENAGGSVRVSWVVADSPLATAGLHEGDVITAIDGKPVGDALDAFARTRGGDGTEVALSYRRDGVDRTVTVVRAH